MNTRPHAIEAEKSILGCVLLDQEVFNKIASILSPSDFYQETHKNIYQSFVDMFRSHKPIDIVTIATDLNSKGQLDGAEYLAELQNSVPVTTHATQYAKIVRHRSIQRQIQRAGEEIIEIGGDNTSEAEKLLSEALKAIKRVSDKQVKTKDLADNYGEWEEYQSHEGLMTGLGFLDESTKGLRDDTILAINAYTGKGKTTIAMQIAVNLMKNKKVNFYSLEMSSPLVLDMMSRITGKEVFDFVSDNGQNFSIINNMYNWDLIELHALNTEPDVIIIDYAQIVDIDGNSTEQKLFELGKRIMQFARDTNTICVVLSQWSQNSANNQSGIISSKGGNGIQESSDIFINIKWREEEEIEARKDYYRNQSGFSSPTVKRSLVIEKNRLGKTGGRSIDYDFTKGLYIL